MIPTIHSSISDSKMKSLSPFLALGFLVAGSLAFLFSTKKVISTSEQRTLATWPDLSWEGYHSGSYFKGISSYMNDHFPLRDEMVEWAQRIRFHMGFHLPEEERVVVLPKTKTSADSPADSLQRVYQDDFRAAYAGGMLIIEGKVYPQGGGAPSMARPFATMVNRYAEELKGICTVYTCIAPLSSAFIPVEKYARYNRQNQKTLEAIRTALLPEVRYIDIFGEMDAHFGESMFFGSDHHWNARGAYYAYSAFCQGAGVKAVPLENMRYEQRKPFLGSLYNLTKDPVVAQHPDTLELFIPQVETKAVRYAASGLTSTTSTRVFGTTNNYGAFLGGDAPLVRISTDVKNGRRAMVIKNSMGNAFAVYLISHYEEIWVVDFRYSGHNVMEIIADEQIDDLIFGIGLYAAMSHGTISMMRNLAKPHSPAMPFGKRPTVMPDTLKLSGAAQDSIPNEGLDIDTIPPKP